ncbi:MAG: hypothetical protein KAH25_07705 [Bacteroidales bacterium]|nr:hypothetical protein [Bacteroidales bacterium]
MEKKIKIGLLAMMAVLLTIPLVQLKFHFLKPAKKLDGSFKKNEKPTFSYESWFDGSFQASFEASFNQHFGFRNNLVRVHNQLNYSLFNKANTKGVIIGKDNFLFEKLYIDSYTGTNYIGQTTIDNNVEKIRRIYQHLKKHQTELLIIIAPGKGFFYPEYIPTHLKEPIYDSTNYKSYIEALAKTNIPIIDFNALFITMRDTSSMVIYPKTGIHWSQGILPYVADSILKKSAQILNKELNTVIVDKMNILADTADKQDADIERSMNLIYKIGKPQMNYPIWQFEQNPRNTKPKMIAIGDSFWWQLFNSKISKKVFNKATFWYYYNSIFPQSFKKRLAVEQIDALYELEQTDLVIITTTEANLFKFPFGFEDVLYPKPIHDSAFKARVESLSNYIKTNETWYNNIKASAEIKNITVDSALKIEASYTIREEIKKEIREEIKY